MQKNKLKFITFSSQIENYHLHLHQKDNLFTHKTCLLVIGEHSNRVIKIVSFFSCSHSSNVNVFHISFATPHNMGTL